MHVSMGDSKTGNFDLASSAMASLLNILRYRLRVRAPSGFLYTQQPPTLDGAAISFGYIRA